MLRITAAMILLACLALCSCNKLEEWRNRQIQTSHTAAQQGGKVLPPAVPIAVPDDVLETLPVDSSFTFTYYVNYRDSIELKAISAWDVETTANWMLARLAEMGYDSGDNPSRLLEGSHFQGSASTKYKSIRAKVDLNSSEQCLVEIFSVPKG